MIVYTYAAIDPAPASRADYVGSEERRSILSRFLYVDRDGDRISLRPLIHARKM